MKFLIPTNNAVPRSKEMSRFYKAIACIQLCSAVQVNPWGCDSTALLKVWIGCRVAKPRI